VNTTLRFAIWNAGYRRIDCAPVYFNEDVIGDTLHDIMNNLPTNVTCNNSNVTTAASVDNAIQRSDLYLVSKLPSPFHRQVELAVRKTLNDLRVDYLDLYLGTLDDCETMTFVPPSGYQFLTMMDLNLLCVLKNAC
jgi:diketogulonate reductase-like aldo/keto reductase